MSLGYDWFLADIPIICQRGAVHRMVVTLEKRGLITRVSGQNRSMVAPHGLAGLDIDTLVYPHDLRAIPSGQLAA